MGERAAGAEAGKLGSRQRLQELEVARCCFRAEGTVGMDGSWTEERRPDPKGDGVTDGEV